MRGFPQRVLLSLACFVALAALAACPPQPSPQRPDADAAPAPVVHADCSAAGKHYAAVCKKSDSNVTAGVCQAIVPNMPEYADCLVKAASCDDGTACDIKAAAHQPKPTKPPVNGH